MSGPDIHAMITRKMISKTKNEQLKVVGRTIHAREYKKT